MAFAASKSRCVACSWRGACSRDIAESSRKAVSLSVLVECANHTFGACDSHYTSAILATVDVDSCGCSAQSWSALDGSCVCQATLSIPAAPAWRSPRPLRCATAAPQRLRTRLARPASARQPPVLPMSAGPQPRAGSAQPTVVSGVGARRVGARSLHTNHRKMMISGLQTCNDQVLDTMTAEGSP